MKERVHEGGWVSIQQRLTYLPVFLVRSPDFHAILLHTGKGVLAARSIPVAIHPSCQVMKTVALYLHKR